MDTGRQAQTLDRNGIFAHICLSAFNCCRSSAGHMMFSKGPNASFHLIGAEF
jgi:hypothetical protein